MLSMLPAGTYRQHIENHIRAGNTTRDSTSASVAATTGRAGETWETGACGRATTASAVRKNCLQLFQRLQEPTRQCMSVQPVILKAGRHGSVTAIVAIRDTPEAAEMVDDRGPGSRNDVGTPLT